MYSVSIMRSAQVHQQDIHINLGHASNQQLKLTLIEHIDEVLGDELAEAGHEGLKLLLDTLSNTIFHDMANVFLLVFFSDRDIGTTWLQLHRDHLAETFFSCCESLVDNIGDIVLTGGYVSKGLT